MRRAAPTSRCPGPSRASSERASLATAPARPAACPRLRSAPGAGAVDRLPRPQLGEPLPGHRVTHLAGLRGDVEDQLGHPGCAPRCAPAPPWPALRAALPRGSSRRPAFAPGIADGSAAMDRSYISSHGDRPAAPRLADEAVVADVRAGEEHLVEPVLAVHLVQRPDLDDRLADVDDEELSPWCLGMSRRSWRAASRGRPTGTGGADSSARPPSSRRRRPRRPPRRAARAARPAPGGPPGSARLRGRIRAGLGEELAPGLLATGQRGQGPGPLLLASVHEQHRPAEQLAEPGRRRQRTARGEGGPHTSRRVRGQPAPEPPRWRGRNPEPDSASRAHQARTVRSGSQWPGGSTPPPPRPPGTRPTGFRPLASQPRLPAADPRIAF